MKKIIFSLAIFSLCLTAQELYTLKVSTKNLRNNKGVVQFSIYNTPNSLPDEKFKKYFKQKTASIINNTSSITFKLPKGIYAVNILHDENKNGQIDKGFMLPIEGVGLSNYKTINLFNRPNFKDASFKLNKNKNINIKINYF